MGQSLNGVNWKELYVCTALILQIVDFKRSKVKLIYLHSLPRNINKAKNVTLTDTLNRKKLVTKNFRVRKWIRF